MKASLIILQLFLILLCINISTQLYFHIEKGIQKCFHDDFYSDTTVIIEYRVLTNLGSIEEIDYPAGKIIFSIIEDKTEKQLFEFREQHIRGKFSFHLNEGAKVLICIDSLYSPWFRDNQYLEVSYQVNTSEDKVDKDTATEKEFSGVENKIHELLKMCSEVEEMQTDQIQAEDNFSDSQISNSSSIIIFTIIQLVIILIAGVFEFINIKKIYQNTQ